MGYRLWPRPFTASLALLFASALGAYATAWGLSGGKLSLFTIQIAFEVNGDVSFDPGKASGDVAHPGAASWRLSILPRSCSHGGPNDGYRDGSGGNRVRIATAASAASPRRPPACEWRLLAALLYLTLPLLATLLFSLATVWSRTILPEGYTLDWYSDGSRRRSISCQPRPHTVQATHRRGMILSPLLVVPALLAVHLRAPKWKPWLEFLSIMPWALPGVVLALAMIRAYISPYNVNRPALLILTYVLISLPFMFRSIDASLSSIDARTLVEAAQMLGAGWFDIGRRVLLPGILPGLMSGILLIAALAAGEFALASLLAGSGWKTFPIYQAQAQEVDGRVASALAVIGLLYVLAVSLSLLYIAGRSGGRSRAWHATVANK